MKQANIMSKFQSEDTVSYNIRKIINEFIAVFTVMAKNNGIEIICIVDNNIPDYISGNLYEFEYILVNLLNNTIQYSKNGKVEIEVEMIDEEIEKYIKLTLKDTSGNNLESRTKDLYSNINTSRGFISKSLMKSSMTEVKMQEFLVKGNISYSFTFPYKDGGLCV